MKASDVKTDGTEYAFQNTVHSYGRRVKVLGKHVVKGSRYDTADQTGWLVEFLDDPLSGDRYGTPKGGTKAVTGRQLVGLWSVFNAQAEAERERQAASKAAYEAEKEKQEQAKTALASLFSRYGIGEGINPQREMRFTASGLNSLLEDLVKAVTDEMF